MTMQDDTGQARKLTQFKRAETLPSEAEIAAMAQHLHALLMSRGSMCLTANPNGTYTYHWMWQPPSQEDDS